MAHPNFNILTWCLIIVIAVSIFHKSAFGQDEVMTEEAFLEGITVIGRMTEQRPFLKDSLDVIHEKQSLNNFFTDKIYEKLKGNAYYGYTWDEGFNCSSREVSIVEIKDLTGTIGPAYLLALQQSLTAGGYKINPKSACQIGIAIVGVEPAETETTLPGVLIEAFLRNAMLKKTFFIRFGTGSYEGFAVSIRTSAARIYSELEERYNGQ